MLYMIWVCVNIHGDVKTDKREYLDNSTLCQLDVASEGMEFNYSGHVNQRMECGSSYVSAEHINSMVRIYQLYLRVKSILL